MKMLGLSDEIFKAQSTDVLLETQDIDFKLENDSKPEQILNDELEVEFK